MSSLDKKEENKNQEVDRMILTVEEWLDEFKQNPSLDEFLIKLGQARLGFRRKIMIMKKFEEASGFYKNK